MTQISASLLGAAFDRMGQDVTRAEKAGVDSFHIDFMDGHYVPNFALAPDHLLAISSKTNLPLKVHLEVENPDHLLETFKPFPAHMIIVQWDTCPDPLATFQRIRERDAEVGVGLLPLVPMDPLIPFLDMVDLLLLLGVQPGFGGQKMIKGALTWMEGIIEIRDRQFPELAIAVDGGIKYENGANLVQLGFDELIMGSALFEADDMESLVARLKHPTHISA